MSYAGRSKSVMVELAALKYYASFGYRGVWSENGYWTFIMALLFRDIIFARLPGVYSDQLGDFPGKLQDMPHDFFRPEFYSRRAKMIEKRISNLLACASISKEINDAYAKHKGEPCRPIWNWDAYSIDDLCLGAESISREQLFLIMKRLLADFGKNRSGLPDLFLCTPKPLLVEVKSGSDSLRESQVEWLQFLLYTVGLSVEVLLVNHTDHKIRLVQDALAAGSCDTILSVDHPSLQETNIQVSKRED